MCNKSSFLPVNVGNVGIKGLMGRKLVAIELGTSCVSV